MKLTLCSVQSSRAALSCILALLLAGCIGHLRDFEEPTVTLNYFQPSEASSGILNFKIGLNVINPNDFPLKLEGAAYSVSMDGYDLLAGAASDLPEIPAYGSSDVEIDAQASFLNSIQFLRSLTMNPRDRFDYKFDAKFKIDGVPTTVNVAESGTLAFQP